MIANLFKLVAAAGVGFVALFAFVNYGEYTMGILLLAGVGLLVLKGLKELSV